MKTEKDILKSIYGFEFPDDFFSFYDFTQKFPHYFNGGLAGHDSPTGISLGSVFQVFKNKNEFQKVYNLQTDRHYNDPPEFFTLLLGDSDGLHWGYYLDAPNEMKPILCSYYSNDAFELSYVGDSLFETLRYEVETHYESTLENLEDPEFEDAQKHLDNLNQMRNHLNEYSLHNRPEKGDEYLNKYRKHRKVTAKTRCGIGIIVPKSTYKEVSIRDPFQIWNYVPKENEISKLEKECYKLFEEGAYGNLLKLGKDLWIYKDYREISYRALEKSYKALGRDVLLKSLNAAKLWRMECDKKRI